MAAKISAELKARVKALRDECKVFIDLRSSTEEECLTYIAKHEPKPVEPEQYASCDVVDSAFHHMQALQLNTDLNTYGEWQKSVFEGCKDSFCEWFEKQAPLVQPEYPSCDVLEGAWNEGVCLLQKDLVTEAPRNIAQEMVEEAKQTDTYWLSWNAAYQSAVDILTAPVHKELEIEDYAHLFTFADLSSLVTDAVNAISKNLVKALRSIWSAIPQKYQGAGKAMLKRRRDEIFSRCNSFKEMVKASKLISKLGA